MKMLKVLFALTLAMFGLSVSALAAVPAEITTLDADLTSVWTLVKTLIISIGVFIIMWKFFRRGVNKAG